MEGFYQFCGCRSGSLSRKNAFVLFDGVYGVEKIFYVNQTLSPQRPTDADGRSRTGNNNQDFS